MTEKIKKDLIKEESKRLLDKQFDDFFKYITKGDSSAILLKGHLLVEHYLDHAMLLILDKDAKVYKKSFYSKIFELKSKDCFWEHSVAIDCLSALNKVRNELAHRLDLNFNVTLSQIDIIGYPLGKEYIIKRYVENLDEKELLLWTLKEVIMMVYYPISVNSEIIERHF